MSMIESVSRREFLSSTSKVVAGAVLLDPFAGVFSTMQYEDKHTLAMVGTGHRGVDMWGKSVVEAYGDKITFVGLCDVNPGRLAYAKQRMKVTCPTYLDFEKMIRETKPDRVIVTTIDGTHHDFIIKAMEMGCDVISEKPLTTDEVKLGAILEAQKRYNKQITVTFNYRYSPQRAKVKELLMQGRIGKLRSVDFHWYLDIYHGADYFRRWHRLRQNSGSLLVHKATHHFDLLNWWINSEPEVVHAFGALEFYGKNNSFRHSHCRPCPQKEKCQFYWDITKDKRLVNLYVDNEHYDGYLRDGCVWREDIDIFDKMAVQMKYANKVQVSYSLTTYSPYEGYRVAFNGTKGRLDTWVHERQPWPMDAYDEIRVTDNFGSTELIQLPRIEGDHAGGDTLMKDKIFKDPSMPDPLKQAAGLRDGAMSALVGIAARKSIDSGKPVYIAELTDLVPQSEKPE